MIKLYKGDCLVESNKIEDGSVDLILTDPPYGTVENIGGNAENIKHGMKNKTSWDVSIDPIRIFDIANRILRRNGKLVLFSQQPYTTELISKAIPNLPHCYNMIWEKDHFANSLIAKKAPVSYYEDILVFKKNHDIEGLHPLRRYFKNVMDFIGLGLNQINKRLGHRRAEHTFYINSTQFSLCTEDTYNELIEVFNIDKMEGFKTYSELRLIDKEYDNVFNLWDGKKYKSNILKYKKDYGGLHPAQKPVLLLEDLIKTFS
ncbi:TPA: site-specific DNA-methyltransferase, partial [bacterium]|nr:site-specific DNA-methyltransferase [bacterium]